MKAIGLQVHVTRALCDEMHQALLPTAAPQVKARLKTWVALCVLILHELIPFTWRDAISDFSGLARNSLAFMYGSLTKRRSKCSAP